jgi:hypothetical protein
MNINEMTELDLCISNFDHSIDVGTAKALKDNPGKVYADYAGWNFHGRVYFHAKQFHCEVQVYGSVMQVISENTLPEIMDTVCEEYGNE